MEVKRKSRILGLDIMAVLLTLLLLWACEALGAWGALLLPLALFPLCLLTAERRWVALGIAYLLPAVLIALLPFSHIAWFGFVFVCGWYAPVRRLLGRVRAGWQGSLIAFGLCNAGLILGWAVLLLFGANLLAGVDPFWIVVVLFLTEIGCLLLDVAYQLFTRLWFRRLKRFLLV